MPAAGPFQALAHGLSPYKNAKTSNRLQAGVCVFHIFARLIAYVDIIPYFQNGHKEKEPLSLYLKREKGYTVYQKSIS